MNKNRRLFVPILIMGLPLAIGFAQNTTKLVWNFESDSVGALPQDFLSVVGVWTVASDSEGKGKVLAQSAENPTAVYNIAVVPALNLKDVDLSVRMKAIEGKIDQGGGLVWREQNSQNYYIARYNPLEDNFRVYKVVDGKRTQLKSVDIPHHDDWYTIRGHHDRGSDRVLP